MVNGCFYCHTKNAPMSCSRCNFARYCNRDCQKKDWRGPNTLTYNNHKELCGIYCANRNDNMFIALNMKGCGWTDEALLVDIMRR